MNTETRTDTEIAAGGFPCKKCPHREPFKSQRALSTHTLRAHGKGWSTTGNFRKKKKRASSKSSAKKWTPERRARFEKTWIKKNRKKIREMKNGKNPIAETPLEDPREFINHCPQCGQNLVAYYLASGAERRRRGH